MTTATETTAKPKTNIAKRLFNSPFAIIVALLLAVDVTATGIIPAVAPEWYMANFPNPDRHCAKVLKYLTSNANPDFIILGSSLMRTAAESSDMGMNPELKEARFANDYDKALFLKKELNADTGANMNMLNLAMRGCMASDYNLIFRKALEQGKTPKFVICSTAPAEFMSNDQPVVANTYVHQSLLKYKFAQGKPVYEQVYDEAERLIAPHNLNAVEQVLGYCRRSMATYVSNVTGHPTDLYRAATYGAQKAKGCDEACEKTTTANSESGAVPGNPLADLSHYKLRYHPANTKLFAEHTKNYEQLMKASHDSGIPLVVINMPITAPNKALVDPTLLARYYEFMDSTAKKYNVTYLNMDKKDMFNLSDFQDSSHLNEKGARRFFTALAQDLVKESSYSQIAAGKADGQL